MCGPALALASFAIGTAQAISKNAAAQQDAASQQTYNNQLAYNAEYDRNQKYNSLGLRQQEEVDSASQALFDNQLRAVKARGTADASAADGGVSGNSVESVARDAYMQQGRIDSSTLRNTAMSVNQLQNEKESANSEYRSRTTFSPIKQPSALGLGLDIASAGIQAYDMYDRGQRGADTKGK